MSRRSCWCGNIKLITSSTFQVIFLRLELHWNTVQDEELLSSKVSGSLDDVQWWWPKPIGVILQLRANLFLIVIAFSVHTFETLSLSFVWSKIEFRCHSTQFVEYVRRLLYRQSSPLNFKQIRFSFYTFDWPVLTVSHCGWDTTYSLKYLGPLGGKKTQLFTCNGKGAFRLLRDEMCLLNFPIEAISLPGVVRTRWVSRQVKWSITILWIISFGMNSNTSYLEKITVAFF